MSNPISANETVESVSLERIVISHFNDLTASERTLVASVEHGSVAHSTPPGADASHVAAVDSSEPEHIRGDLIRWLCTNSAALSRIDRRGIRLVGAQIIGAVRLSEALIPFALEFVETVFSDALDLSYSVIPTLDMSGSKVKGMNCLSLRVNGPVRLAHGFSSDGMIDFSMADIAGDLECSRGTFRNSGGCALSLHRATIGGGVFLRDIHTTGEVHIASAHIGGVLECSRSTVQGRVTALNAHRAKIGSDVFLNRITAQGEVHLVAADIKGDLDCTEGTFLNEGGSALNAHGLIVRGSMFLHKIRAAGGIWLANVETDHNLSIWGADLSRVNQVVARGLRVDRSLVLRENHLSAETAIDLEGAKVTTLEDDQASWPHPGRLYLDGFVCGRISGESPGDASARLEWIKRLDKSRSFSRQPYLNLARLEREAGDDNGAKQVLVTMEDTRLRSGGLPLRDYIWSVILRWTIGYGYKPTRALWWAFTAVLLGWCFFGFGYAARIMTPIDQQAYAGSPSNYPAFNPFIYSLDTFLPIIDLGQKTRWMPNANRGEVVVRVPAWTAVAWRFEWDADTITVGTVLRLYLWIHIVVGWALSTLFVAGFTSLVRKG